MPFGDEYYANPLNTLQKCIHDVPVKLTCHTCHTDKRFFEFEHQLKHVEIDIEKAFEKIEVLRTLLQETLKVFERVLTILEKSK